MTNAKVTENEFWDAFDSEEDMNEILENIKNKSEQSIFDLDSYKSQSMSSSVYSEDSFFNLND